jgi:uncharacterized repeat protein (TIGR01451 family)
MRGRGGGFWLGVRSLVVAAAIGGMLAPEAGAKTFPPNWPQSPGTHRLSLPVPRADTPTPAFSQNIRGGYAIVGNTLLTCPENTVPGRKRASSRFGDAQNCINANNNDKNMKYVNVDPAPGGFNSSRATLSVPSGAHAVKAFLYWGADLARGVMSDSAADGAPGGEDPNTNTLWRTVQLKTGAGAFATIDAQAPGRSGLWKGIESWYSQPGNRPGFAYQVRADVTPEIRAALSVTPPGPGGNTLIDTTVANVQAGKGNNRHGGWTLVVIWETNAAAWRNLTLFDGFDFVQVKGGEQLVVGPLKFSGFQTPASGPVDAHVATWTYEGDRSIVNDYMTLGDLTASCDTLKYRVHDAVNPVDNFFNSSISRNGVSVTAKVPNYDNQLGFDLDGPSIPEGTIKNGATGAAVCLGTTGDTYFFGGLAFDTLIRAPNLGITKVVDKPTANPGDTVTYTVKVSNPQRPPGETPTDVATNVAIEDPIPSGLDFISFATQFPPPGCFYDPPKRRIVCIVGTLAPDASFTYSFLAHVSGAAQGSTPTTLLNTACFYANSQDQPSTVFTSCADVGVIGPPAPVPTVDLGVTKSVSAETAKPGDNLVWTLITRNYGPGASTNFTISDTLPLGVGFVSLTAPAGLTCTTPAVGAGGSILCTAAPATVPAQPSPGSEFTLTVVGKVSPTAANGAVLRNLVVVSGDDLEPVPDLHPNRDDAFTRVVVPDQPVPPEPPSPQPVPDPDGNVTPAPPVTPPPPPPGPVYTLLSLTKKAAPPHAQAGGNATFTLKVANTGDASALDVKVCDSLPASVSLVSAPGFVSEGGTICVAVGTLARSASKTYTLTVRVSLAAPSRIVNNATASASNAKSVSAKAAIRVSQATTPGGVVAGVTG